MQDALAAPHVSVVAEGLLGPVGMAALPDGGLLVAEEGTGGRDDSAGVTLITPGGEIGRFLSGLPSSRDAGDLAGVPLVQLSPAGDTLYVGNFGQGHLWSLALTAQQQAGLTLPEAPLAPDDLESVMHPLNNVRLVNPFDMTFDSSGVPVVTDASGNGVAKQTAEGTTRFFHRFAEIPNPQQASDPIEAVPTGIERIPRENGDEYYVTLTGGCPYPAGSGRLVAIDEARHERVVLDDLNMPIDVARGPDGTIWLLEFARFTPGASCFDGSGYNVETGRLSRLLPDGTVDIVLDSLNFPGAVLPLPDGSLYISEVLPGRVLHVTFGEDAAEGEEAAPAEAVPETSGPSAADSARPIPDADAALGQLIDEQKLTPNPGLDLREGDTPLAHLGQLLFFDPILSGDQNVSCATCHHPAFAMADGRVLPIGTGGHGLGPQRTFVEQVVLGADDGAEAAVTNPFSGQFVPRNSPTILNSALLPVQFWDGRVEGYALPASAASKSGTDATAPVKTLERTVNEMAMTDALATQALFPVTSLLEMAGSTHADMPPPRVRRLLVDRLRNQPEYVDLFRTAFAGADDPGAITMRRVVAALAAFERRLIFTDAPWDRYLAGDADALTAEQKRGALLFFGAANSKVNCASCHSGDLFTDLDFHNLMVPQLGPGKGHGYSGREDRGRAGVTFDWRDRYAFRTPPLRNVALTAPYFHDGAFPTLAAAIRHHANMVQSALNYDPAAQEIPPELYSSLQPVSLAREGKTAAPALRAGLPLDDGDVDALVAFLESLTDPAARDLHEFIPASVPSGLPLDPLPAETETAQTASNAVAETKAAPDAAGEEAAPRGGITFRDVAGAVGLDFRHGAFQRGVSQDPVAAMGGGLCWIDFDRDGWLDLYLVNSHSLDERDFWEARGGLPRNALYRNVAGHFVDVSAGSGADVPMFGNGCVAADFDGDGWTDLYVTADGPNALFWNRGDGTFVEGAAAAGVDAAEWNSATAVGDLNGDGLLDLFVAAYIDLEHTIPKPTGHFPQDYYGLADRLYINRGVDAATGRVTFADVAAASGLARTERGLGAIFSDLDDDGDLDLYIANDGHPNRLYANEPISATADPLDIGFRWRDLTGTANVGDSGSGMGVAGGDYDGDGQPDLFVTNWERELNALYRNETLAEGHLTFQYSTFRIGIRGLGNGMTGWGAHLADFDQDTDADLLFVNGRVPVTNLATDPEPVRLYTNRTWSPDGSAGRTGHFFDSSDAVGLDAVGPLMARGSAAADYDNDGDLDVAINSIGGAAVLLQNNSNDGAGDGVRAGGNWLQIVAEENAPGLQVRLALPDGRILLREVQSGSSYLASEDPRLHFGVGAVETVPLVSVRWPDGRTVTLRDVSVNQMLVVGR